MTRVIAFYLPQFHPIPENDGWWGAGFTEWTNVSRARPLFRGHTQPHLPADLGFYDLRVPEVRIAQADLASRYGIDAFCYWHYWFGNGRRILERPFSEVVASGVPTLPFCLGWANQTWTGVWHGAQDRVLIKQKYPGAEDDRAHFEHLLPAFRDSRYFCVDGKPVLYVFRPEELPDALAWTGRWRQMAEEAGLAGLHLIAEVSDLLGYGPRYSRVGEDGFDGGTYIRIPAVRTRSAVAHMRFRRKVLRHPERYRHDQDLPKPPHSADRTELYPCVYPAWDNTPRSGRRGLVIERSDPAILCDHIREAVLRVESLSKDHQLIFVKSWNEWAEGNYLEPDERYGHEWLKAVRDGLL